MSDKANLLRRKNTAEFLLFLALNKTVNAYMNNFEGWCWRKIAHKRTDFRHEERLMFPQKRGCIKQKNNE